MIIEGHSALALRPGPLQFVLIVIVLASVGPCLLVSIATILIHLFFDESKKKLIDLQSDASYCLIDTVDLI